MFMEALTTKRCVALKSSKDFKATTELWNKTKLSQPQNFINAMSFLRNLSLENPITHKDFLSEFLKTPYGEQKLFSIVKQWQEALFLEKGDYSLETCWEQVYVRLFYDSAVGFERELSVLYDLQKRGYRAVLADEEFDLKYGTDILILNSFSEPIAGYQVKPISYQYYGSKQVLKRNERKFHRCLEEKGFLPKLYYA